MTILFHLLQGVLIGVFISVPVGPVNVICLYQTIQNGRTYGFKVTIGATIADTIYAIIACWGVNVFINFINSYRTVFELSSGIVILIFGLVLFFKKPVPGISQGKNSIASNIGDYMKSFLFSISNPLTVLFFVAYIAAMRTTGLGFDTSMSGYFVAGVVIGSMSWFYFLSGIVARFKEKLTEKHFSKVNITFGCILCISGAVLLFKTMAG